MSRTENIPKRVTDLVTDVLQTRIPAQTTDLIDAGILDSLGFVDLIARLEQEFDIHISLETVGIDQFRSVQAIAAYVSGVPESAAA